VALDGIETGTITGVGKLGMVSMYLEGEGLFDGGTFTYTCATTATIENDIAGDDGQSADVNRDQEIGIADAVTILEGLFGGVPAPCPAAAEINGDGGVDIADAIFLLNYLFGDGPRPVEAVVPCQQ
jgi:hypothetical protein